MKTKPSHADFAGARYLALQRLARSQGRPTDELLQLYILECFLRRLSLSPYRERLVLKGGLLLAAFDLRRATRDVDLLALRVDNDPAAVERVIVEVATTEAEDGVEFVLDALHTEAIRDDDAYPGVRVTLFEPVDPRPAGTSSGRRRRFNEIVPAMRVCKDIRETAIATASLR